MHQPFCQLGDNVGLGVSVLLEGENLSVTYSLPSVTGVLPPHIQPRAGRVDLHGCRIHYRKTFP